MRNDNSTSLQFMIEQHFKKRALLRYLSVRITRVGICFYYSKSEVESQDGQYDYRRGYYKRILRQRIISGPHIFKK